MELATHPACGLQIFGPADFRRNDICYSRYAKRLIVFVGTDCNAKNSPFAEQPISGAAFNFLTKNSNPAFVCLCGSTVDEPPILTGCIQVASFHTPGNSDMPAADCFVFIASGKEYGIATITDSEGNSYLISGIGSNSSLQMESYKSLRRH